MFQSGPVVDTLILAVGISNLACALAVAFVVCDLSERLGNSFISVGNMFDQFDWYNFTEDMQRTLPLILIHVHEPVALGCFGSIACNRETFKCVSITK